MLLIILIGLCVSRGLAEEGGCSCIDQLLPTSCVCEEAGDSKTRVTCHSFNESDTIGKEKNCLLTSFSLQNTTLVALPPAFLGGLKLRYAEFREVTIYLLGQPKESESPFAGLEDSLERFEVRKSQTVFTWKWELLSRLRALKALVVQDSLMVFLPQLGNVSPNSLRLVEITGCSIKWIHPKVFDRLKMVTMITLHDNHIDAVKRSMFPKPAKHLYSIDLSNNMLRSLPSDLFKAMPSLVELRLDHNQLTALQEKVLLPLLQQLNELWVNDNSLSCDDGKLCWLLKKKQNWRRPMFLDAAECSFWNGENTRLAYLEGDALNCKR